MSPSDAKVTAGKQLIVQAKSAHESGRHAESMASAEKAARVLGVQLKLTKMTPGQEAQVRAAEQRLK